MEVGGIPLEVVRKAIKNLYFTVYPPDGRVRVAVPRRLDDDALRVAIRTKLGWIRRKQAELRSQPRQSPRQMVSGESHYVAGNRYLLTVVERDAAPQVRLVGDKTLELQVGPGASQGKRAEVLRGWYRAQLSEAIPPLIAKWESKMGVSVAEWRIKRMKTRWGTCNIQARRIWFNLELAKHAPACLEYIVVHEMVHLLERRHNDRFKGFMDQFLPNWRVLKDELNRGPVEGRDYPNELHLPCSVESRGNKFALQPQNA